MGTRPGHIELERALSSIEVGRRHRTDLGDIAALAASIARDGLLQPITITPDGILVCGLRRLEALRQPPAGPGLLEGFSGFLRGLAGWVNRLAEASRAG